ncbi:MAG TPA: hypothetical protein VF221_18755 [Chloroflexota bacterium]
MAVAIVLPAAFGLPAALGLPRAMLSASDPARSHPSSRAASPLPGSLLIADKRNNRLLVVGRLHRVKWEFPHGGDLPRGQLFLIPDDAFYTPHRHTILATEEDYNVIREIDVRSRHIIWQYGHPGIPGSSTGYLSGPDDAYRLSNGLTTVADIRNCRILFIDSKERVVRQYGRPGDCRHDPPRAFAAPNGDTPGPGGGMLVTEIGGSWIDFLSKTGRLVWAFQSPLQYPSDAQLLPNGHILVCDYTFPGRVVEFDTHSHIVGSFGSSSGPNLLNHPSLAIRLPNGLTALNDDWNHRVIIVDMRSGRIVWQYGVTGVAGDSHGYLNNPDGIDFNPKH